MSAEIRIGDCLAIMPTLDACSVDAIVCDPPYGLSFMGKDWDHGVPGEHFWREALRVAKPGAHLIAFGGTRTHHRLMVAIEDAGWQIRDTLGWLFGSGFPKSLDVSKAIDREAGAVREIVGRDVYFSPNRKRTFGDGERYGTAVGGDEETAFVTAAATTAAKVWQGWGTALKPAWEPIILARKPLTGTVAANVQVFGTGAMNIDGCRVEGENTVRFEREAGNVSREMYRKGTTVGPKLPTDYGRWPANIIHDGSDEVVALFPETDGGGDIHRRSSPKTSGTYGAFAGDDDRWQGYADTGSAARFFYVPKADRDDRNAGLHHLPHQSLQIGANGGINPTTGRPVIDIPRGNHHPTVKPTDLMRYLCRLVTPPGGLILDPFCGSGSTGKAALLEGFNFLGIEIDPEYAALAEARIYATAPLFVNAIVA